jgi:hypothetical protein
MDGEIAAIEQSQGGGCTRSVSFVMPSAGDAILRPDYARLLTAIHEPCGIARNFAPMTPTALTALEGEAALAPTSAIKPRATHMTPLVPWLLAAALVLAFLELLVRKFSGSGAAGDEIRETTARTPSGRAAA